MEKRKWKLLYLQKMRDHEVAAKEDAQPHMATLNLKFTVD